MNDVNLLLKQRENEKSSPKAWNHQLQQDSFVFIDHGIGVVDLSVNMLGRLVRRIWHSIGAAELEGIPMIFAGHAITVHFLDDIEQIACLEGDTSRLHIINGCMLFLLLQQM